MIGDTLDLFLDVLGAVVSVALVLWFLQGPPRRR